MEIPKKYLHDRVILFLHAINIFLVFILTALILFRVLDATRSGAFFVQYRSNLGLNAYKIGGSLELISFIAFGVLVAAFHALISLRIYTLYRQLAIAVLGFATLLLGLSIVVSNALLVLG